MLTRVGGEAALADCIELMEDMHTFKYALNNEFCSCIITVCMRLNNLEVAESVLDCMN